MSNAIKAREPGVNAEVAFKSDGAVPSPTSSPLEKTKGPEQDRLNGWLDDVLYDLRKNGLPDRLASAAPEAVARYWPPSRPPSEEPEAAHFLKSHPDVNPPFQSLPAMKIRRHKPTYGWGIKKELTSSVTGRAMFAESSLEFDALRYLELESTNTWFIEQPVQIRYHTSGTTRLYRPDILVRRATSAEFIEIKFEVDADKLEDKWAAIGETLSSLGYGFRVLTERHLRRSPLHENVRLIFNCRHARPPKDKVVEALASIQANAATIADDLIRMHDLSFENVCFLIRHSVLSANIKNEQLNKQCRLKINLRGRRDLWLPRA